MSTEELNRAEEEQGGVWFNNSDDHHIIEDHYDQVEVTLTFDVVFDQY